MSKGKLVQPSVSEGKLAQSSVSEEKLVQPRLCEGKLVQLSVTEGNLEYTPKCEYEEKLVQPSVSVKRSWYSQV